MARTRRLSGRGVGKIAREFLPPRRYSFSLGSLTLLQIVPRFRSSVGNLVPSHPPPTVRRSYGEERGQPERTHTTPPSCPRRARAPRGEGSSEEAPAPPSLWQLAHTPPRALRSRSHKIASQTAHASPVATPRRGHSITPDALAIRRQRHAPPVAHALALAAAVAASKLAAPFATSRSAVCVSAGR